MDCLKTCYLFHTGLNNTTNIYNISKYPLPKNFEAKLLFTSVDWVRTGITFNKEILEDLVQFYTKKSGWKNCFNKGGRALKPGDTMTITLHNGEMRYAVNDMDLGSFIKIDMSNKNEMFLFVHTRNPKSKAEIVYICETFN